VDVFTQWNFEEVGEAVAQTELVIAIGGDGAMLRAARVCAPLKIPILGINMGQLGFLTEISAPDHWDEHETRILKGQWWTEKRMMLYVTVVRDGQVIAADHALNDVVISGNMFGRMVQLETYIDGDWTTTYYADALVTATATGSTAYALACGGPILPPELKNILIVPAAPHLSLDRPLVLAEGATVEVHTTGRGDVVMSADGRVIHHVETGDVVRVRSSEYESHFARFRGKNYFYRSLLDRLEPLVRRHSQSRDER
jgi:NAD+ kinase